MNARPAPEPRVAYRHFRQPRTRWMDNDAITAACARFVHVDVDRHERRPVALPAAFVSAVDALEVA